MGACLASERPAKPAGRIPETFQTAAPTRSLGSCRVAKATLSRAWPAPTILQGRIHGGSWAPRPNLPKVPAAQQSSEERLSVSDNPGHWNLPSERVCVLPFRDPGEQDVRQGAYRDVFTAFPEGQNTDSRPRMESPHFRCRDAIRAPVRQVSGIPPGASLPFAGRARSHSR